MFSLLRLCLRRFVNSGKCYGSAFLALSSPQGRPRHRVSYCLMLKSLTYPTILLFVPLFALQSLSCAWYRPVAVAESLRVSRGRAGENLHTLGSWADSTRTSPWSTRCWRRSPYSSLELNGSGHLYPDREPRLRTFESREEPYLGRRRSTVDRHRANRRSDTSAPKELEAASPSQGYQNLHQYCALRWLPLFQRN